MDEEEFDKVPLEERCFHKNWKARLSGYSAVAKLFEKLDDEHISEWNKYVHIITNILTDINDPALEKGLEVILIFVDKSFEAHKTASQVMPLLVKRCLSSSRPLTRGLSTDICLKYIEIGAQSIVLHELLKGTDMKTPKLIVTCIQVINKIVSEFGVMIFEVKSLLEKVVVLLEDRDVNVRNSSKALVIELFKWLGSSVKPYLNQLKPSKFGEVVADIAKIQDLSPVPTRFLRSELKQSTSQPRNVLEDHQSVDPSQCAKEIDPFTAFHPEDVISEIPPDFTSLIKSRKWSERKDILEKLENILSKTKRIKSGDFTELVAILRKVISKDTNIIVVSTAIRCVTLMAMGLRSDFRTHVSEVFKVLSEKLKERKISVVSCLREAMDALLKCSSLEALIPDLVSLLQHKNPNVKSEIALFLSRCFLKMQSTDLIRKTMKPIMLSLAAAVSDQDPTVRNNAAKALGVAVRIAGENRLSPILGDIDHQKMVKIKEYANIPETSHNKPETTISISNPPPISEDQPLTQRNLSKTVHSSVHPRKTQEIDAKLIKKVSTIPVIPNKTKQKSDEDNHIPDNISAGLSNDNWAIRLQAISDLKKNILETELIPYYVGHIAEQLSYRILDNNPKIATTSISVVTTLAEKMGKLFISHIPTFLPSLLKCVGDSKKWVSQPAVECLNSLSKHCGYVEILKCGEFTNVLKSGSQNTRVILWQWISKSLNNVPLIDTPREELEYYLLPLFMSLEDRNREVRNTAATATKSLVKLLGFQAVLSSSERYFKDRKNPLNKLLVDQSEDLKLECMEVRPKVNSSTEALKLRGVKANPSSEDEQKSPLLGINNLKHQRVIDEHRNKIIKWDFSVPRAEFVELLRSLMSAANFSQSLMSNMFHDDFKHQLAAIDILLVELQHNSQAVVSNLDLILRWLTLRFFDTCPIILTRGLDFLATTFDVLKEINYCFLDSEASILVPYIILKMADSRDIVQMKVKEVLFKLSNLYPVSNLKKFLLDGLRTKNARQKVNCLDVLKYFVDNYGESMYIKDMDIVAEQIVKLLKDHDSEVKKSAFSVAASMFCQEGEKMLKFVEKYAGTNGTIFEERIKKLASARRIVSDENIQHNATSCDSVKNVNSQSCTLIRSSESSDQKRRESFIVNTNRPSLSDQETNSSMFKLDWELLKNLDSAVNEPIRLPKLTEVDIEYLKDDNHPVLLPSDSTESYKLFCALLNTPEKCIDGIVNDDPTISIQAMEEIDKMLHSDPYTFSLANIDSIVHQVARQLYRLTQLNYEGHFRCFGTIFTLLLTLCSTKRFVEQISRPNICFLLEQLLLLISKNVFGEEVNKNYRSVINKIILKILVNGRKTDLLCVLLEKMGGSEDSTYIGGRINELFMKCLWKLIRTQSSWDAELDYFEVFKSMRILVKSYDFDWWTSKTDNSNALRTMKTVLRVMVKSRGERIISDAKINSSSEKNSGLDIYVRKLLESSRLKRRGLLEIEDLQKPNFLLRHAYDLSDIFKTLSVNPLEGMELLNKFTCDHPEIDVKHILSEFSPSLYEFFVRFNGQGNSLHETLIDDETNATRNAECSDFSGEAQRLWGRLKILQERVNKMTVPAVSCHKDNCSKKCINE